MSSRTARGGFHRRRRAHGRLKPALPRPQDRLNDVGVAVVGPGDDAPGAEAFDGGLRVAEFGEDVAGVLANHRGGPSGIAGRVAERDEIAELAHPPEQRMLVLASPKPRPVAPIRSQPPGRREANRPSLAALRPRSGPLGAPSRPGQISPWAYCGLTGLWACGIGQGNSDRRAARLRRSAGRHGRDEETRLVGLAE
jgi:hypothetical protein